MRKLCYISLAGIVTLAFPSFAFAYIDPGAGSMLLQLLLGGVAGLFVFFRLFKQKILKLFGFGKDDEGK
ncbi:MAG: hypothetical protein IH899_18685 [Planctomycetes bacterium]|nr:hypothetical protein [Planctomycetota bacterium]